MAIITAGAMSVVPAAARASMSWSPPTPLDRATQLSVTAAACPSSTVCVAFDTAGRETTLNPQVPASRRSVSMFEGNKSNLGLSYPPGLACPSATQCTAVTIRGQEATFDPADPAAVTRDTIDSVGLVSVACPTTSQCTAVDLSGDEVTFNPAAPGAPAGFYVDRDGGPEAVVCASITECFSFDSQGGLYGFNPRAPAPGAYQPISPAGNITGLTCPSTSLCVYASGGDLITFAPTDAAGATSTAIDPNFLTGLSCVSATQCTAVDYKGEQVTFNPTSPGTPPAITVDGITSPTALACATATQCTEFDSSDDAVTFDPKTPLPAAIDSTVILGFACPTSTQCTGIDIAQSGGEDELRELTFDPSAPGTPSPVTIDEVASGALSFIEPFGIACPSATECTVVDHVVPGGIQTFNHQLTFDPQNAKAPTPVSVPFTGALACASNHQCTIASGGQEDTFDPTAGSAPGPVTIDSGGTLGALSCPSTSECTALDAAAGATSAVTFDPNAPNGLTRVNLGGFGPEGLSCPIATQCTTWAGGQETTFDPTAGGYPPPPTTVDPSIGGGTMQIMCPSSTECVGEDSDTGARVFAFDPSNPSLSVPAVIDGGRSVTLRCASAQFCVGVDVKQGVFTLDPGSLPNLPVQLEPGPGLTSVSCVTASLCTAVDDAGYEVTFNPATPTTAQSAQIEASSFLTGVACTGASTCAAVDNDGGEVTFDPSSPTGPTTTGIDPSTALTGVACATASLCVAADAHGNVITFAPAAASSAVIYAIDSGFALAGVACPSAGQCTAVDSGGREVTFDPASPGGATPVAVDAGHSLTAISCASDAGCVATDADGALVTFDPDAPAGAARSLVDPGVPLLAISCPTTGFCLAVDAAGRELDGDPATPSAITPAATGDPNSLPGAFCTAPAQCIVVDDQGDLLIGAPGPTGSAGGGTGGGTATGHPGGPRISSATLTISRMGRVTLRLRIQAGTDALALSAVSLSLPRGLAFKLVRERCRHHRACAASVKGLAVAPSVIGAVKLAHGTLTIALARQQRQLSLTATSPLVRALPALMALIDGRHGKPHTLKLILTVRVTDSARQTSTLTVAFKRRVR